LWQEFLTKSPVPRILLHGGGIALSSYNTKRSNWPLFVLLSLLGLTAFCFSFINICPIIELILPALKINKTTIVNFIRSLGAWGPLGSIGLMIIHSFVPFPAEFLTIANGMVFGPFWGVVITWVGAMLGAYASFGLTRIYGRPFVTRNVNSSQLKKLDRWVQHQGTLSLLLGRFIPLISFNLINYGAGLTKISWWTFTWTTAVGILPITIIMVTMGSNINMLPWWAWLIVLIIIIGVAYGIGSLNKKNTENN
jgi:uncharacterized membrane protein YdjX (TVP38/TMEM64 family)